MIDNSVVCWYFAARQKRPFVLLILAMIGTTIGNLTIIAELGRGGMGTVYLAELAKLGRRFAVKRLSSELTQDPRFRERFHREARHQASLQHPNIVQVTDFVEQDGQYFLVMDYVEGQSLDKLIERRGCLAEEEALPILKDILQGLNYAHTQAIIHRDIKPSNIMIGADGKARIMDFGIAILAGEERLTRTESDIGLPWYMSPEQILRPRQIDHRSDVYAVGVVAYEMLTGEVPFDGETDYSIKEQHLHAPVPDIAETNPAIGRELANIIRASLQKDPDERLPGCSNVLALVEKYQSEQLGLKPDRNERGTQRAGDKAHPTGAIQCAGFIGGIVVAALLAVLIWYGVDGFPECDDLVCLLEDQGYVVNIGLTPNYAPGNILQTTEPAADGGERPLATPVVFAWQEQCFPGYTPRQSPFVFIEQLAGRSASLSLGHKILGKLLPALKVDGKVVGEYTLKLGNTHLKTFAKGDLTRQFSESCKRKLIQALEDGDRIEWFAVIVESVVADSATWSMRWKVGASVKAQQMQKNAIVKDLGSIAGVSPGEHDEGILVDDAQTVTVSVDGPIVIGYRMRPIQPVFAE